MAECKILTLCVFCPKKITQNTFVKKKLGQHLFTVEIFFNITLLMINHFYQSFHYLFTVVLLELVRCRVHLLWFPDVKTQDCNFVCDLFNRHKYKFLPLLMPALKGCPGEINKPLKQTTNCSSLK